MKDIPLIGVAVLSLLGGCNSQTSGPAGPTDEVANAVAPPATNFVHFEGIWQGIVTPAASATSLPAIVMVNGWGEFRMVADGMQFVGFPRRTASGIAGEVKGITSAQATWNDGRRVNYFSLSGTISGDEFIDASYNGGADNGTLAVAWAATDQSSEIESIQGVWALYDENQNIVMTLQVDVYDLWQARMSGAHSNGCTYSGNIEAWTSEFSYDVVPFEVSGCPLAGDIDVNGTYWGTGALIDVDGDNSAERVLVIALSNEVNQLTFFLHN